MAKTYSKHGSSRCVMIKAGAAQGPSHLTQGLVCRGLPFGGPPNCGGGVRALPALAQNEQLQRPPAHYARGGWPARACARAAGCARTVLGLRPVLRRHDLRYRVQLPQLPRRPLLQGGQLGLRRRVLQRRRILVPCRQVLRQPRELCQQRLQDLPVRPVLHLQRLFGLRQLRERAVLQ